MKRYKLGKRLKNFEEFKETNNYIYKVILDDFDEPVKQTIISKDYLNINNEDEFNHYFELAKNKLIAFYEAIETPLTYIFDEEIDNKIFDSLKYVFIDNIDLIHQIDDVNFQNFLKELKKIFDYKEN